MRVIRLTCFYVAIAASFGLSIHSEMATAQSRAFDGAGQQGIRSGPVLASPGTLQSLNQAGNQALRGGEFDRAIELYTQALEQAVNTDAQSVLLLNRALALRARGLEQEANQDYQAWLALKAQAEIINGTDAPVGYQAL